MFGDKSQHPFSKQAKISLGLGCVLIVLVAIFFYRSVSAQNPASSASTPIVTRASEDEAPHPIELEQSRELLQSTSAKSDSHPSRSQPQPQ
jgi:hypothetical protein